MFESNQRNTIAWRPGTLPAVYQNLGRAHFVGVEEETKYYLIEDRLFVTGSLLYQHNRIMGLGRQFTPVPNWLIKAGLSYRSPRGWLLSAFDTHMGAPPMGNVPGPGRGFDLLTAQFRVGLARFLPLAPPKLGFFIYGDNLLNQNLRIFDPDLSYPGGIPVGGRALYFGFDVASFGE